MPRGQKNAPATLLAKKEPTLRDEVREALLNVMRDDGSPAGARASAARTLLEFYSDHNPIEERPAEELSESELEAEISRLTKAK